MVEPGPAQHLRTYGQIAWLWIRAAWQYPTSFVLLAVGNGLITGLDFVGLWIMFTHLRDLAGFSLSEVALLYGSATQRSSALPAPPLSTRQSTSRPRMTGSSLRQSAFLHVLAPVGVVALIAAQNCV